jgi:hypothetical protein
LRAGIRCRCTVCNKDLTDAIALLGFEAAREIHVTAHLRDDMRQFVEASRTALAALAGPDHPGYYAGMERDAASGLERALARIGAEGPRAETTHA